LGRYGQLPEFPNIVSPVIVFIHGSPELPRVSKKSRKK
jgi:hypothetical protein